VDLTYRLANFAKDNSPIATHFKQYVKEMRYLRNFSERTLRGYTEAFIRWQKYVGDIPTKGNLDQFVIGMREGGLSPVTCNISIRAFNAFLSWLKSKEYITEPLRLKKLPEEKRKMRVFSDQSLRAILSFKPETDNEHRIFAMVSILIDCGIRINELLTIEKNRVDFDNLLITVKGKGKKERVVPMSIELRRTLHRYYTRHRFSKFESPYFFCTSNGTPITYRNAYRDLEKVFERVGVDKSEIDGFFHQFRRKFARSYIKNGGNMFYLQHAMGHSTLEMTKHYCDVEIEELQAAHLRTSLLSRLKQA
jgi:integrase/recombinase XerD